MFKFTTIFDILRMVQVALYIPDLTITKQNQAKMTRKDYILFVAFETLIGIFQVFSVVTDKKFFTTGSEILDGGINGLNKISFLTILLARLELFWYRYEIWGMIALLHKCDFMVNENFEHSANFDCNSKYIQLKTLGFDVNIPRQSKIVVLILILLYLEIAVCCGSSLTVSGQSNWHYLGLFVIIWSYFVGAMQTTLIYLAVFQRLSQLEENLR